MTWDIEVNTAGIYEVEVYYTCAKNDKGSRIQLTFDPKPAVKVKLIDSQTAKEIQSPESQKASTGDVRVTEPHDPPAIGAKEDRVDRGSESYVKDFRPLSMGTIELPKVRGQLTLKAFEIPGESCIEVRDLVLTLKK